MMPTGFMAHARAPLPVGAPAPRARPPFRALAAVQAALDAHGGLEPLQAAGGVAVVAEGTFDLTVRLQGRSPDEPEPTPALVIGMGLAAEAFWGGFSIARLIPLLAAATP
jgi:hypothetical protein